MPGRLFLLLVFLVCAPDAAAARVEVALRVPLAAIGEALGAELAALPAGPYVLYREGPCRYLRLQPPKLDATNGEVRLFAPGAAAFGAEVLGTCRNAAAWRGTMQFALLPYLDTAGRLRVRVVDSKLADASGNAPALAFLWKLSRRHFHPRLEAFSFDLAGLRDVLVQVMGSAAPPPQHAAMAAALASLEVLPPRLEADAIALPIALQLPDAWLAPPAAAPALSAFERQALEDAVQRWDAFLVHAIKQIALDGQDAALRQRLFTLLLDSRYRLSAILAGEETGAPGDPLRALFKDAWHELRQIVADGQRTGALPAGLLRHVLFLDAGEALLALDRAAPGLGMQVSANGLRHLARSLSPPRPGDPLAFSWAVDPQLGELFHVEPAAGAAPSAPLPGATPSPRSWLERLLPSAHARRSLDAWVPARTELEAYEARIEQLLRITTALQLHRAKLPAPYDRVYERLVPSTALIESCWRQYTVRRGKVTYVRSRAGSIGIMQINQRVWRGFYDIERLRWDTAYNARAGGQILMRYLKDYAIPYAKRTGNPAHAPRAAYAVYNAGPRAVGRFNKAKPHPREKRVDDRLWSLYQAFASGGRVDLQTCGVAKDA